MGVGAIFIRPSTTLILQRYPFRWGRHTEPSQGTDQGHTEIADFHTIICRTGMTLSRTIRARQHRSGTVETTSPLNEDTTVYTVDIFTLNDKGLVQTLDSYYL